MPQGVHQNHESNSNIPRVGATERSPLLRDQQQQQHQPPPSKWETVRTSAQDFWAQGKGMILVTLSQFFGASMNTMTKVLEADEGLHPFQILFARMSITVVASYLYMWYASVPAPFGTRDTLSLLVLRAAGGFGGVYGLYYSVQYLALSEATVLTFLAPILSCYACSFIIPDECFTRKQQLAALVSLMGVVLIARPFDLPFFDSTGPGQQAQAQAQDEPDEEYHRLLATAAALVGVVGAACAYTTIRAIGQRCHALVSVTYFSLFTTVVSFVAMLAVPSVPLALPRTGMQWTLLVGLGICGFLLQFLLTAGLAYVPPRQPEKATSSRQDDGEEEEEEGGGSAQRPAGSSAGSRATNMLYTQMLFALFYDKTVWGSTLSGVSWVGSAMIVGSAMYVAMERNRQ